MNGAQSVQMQAASAPPRFNVVLSARPSSDPPSELEVNLRQYCNRLCVKDKVSGAHLMIPEHSLAIRAYYHYNIERLENQYPATNDILQDEDVDGLNAFLKTFAFSLVLFVLPENIQSRQLDFSNSFTRRAMRILEKSDKMPCILILSNTEQAVRAVLEIVDTNLEAKLQKKQAYFERNSQIHFLPRDSRIDRNLDNHVAAQVTKALRAWATENDLPDGEVDILMSYLGNLYDIVTANDEKLSMIPIEVRTKGILYGFFGSQGETRGNGSDNLDADDLMSVPIAFESLVEPFFSSTGPGEPSPARNANLPSFTTPADSQTTGFHPYSNDFLQNHATMGTMHMVQQPHVDNLYQNYYDVPNHGGAAYMSTHEPPRVYGYMRNPNEFVVGPHYSSASTPFQTTYGEGGRSVAQNKSTQEPTGVCDDMRNPNEFIVGPHYSSAYTPYQPTYGGGGRSVAQNKRSQQSNRWFMR